MCRVPRLHLPENYGPENYKSGVSLFSKNHLIFSLLLFDIILFKNIIQLSRGEICVANGANGASLGS